MRKTTRHQEMRDSGTEAVTELWTRADTDDRDERVIWFVAGAPDAGYGPNTLSLCDEPYFGQLYGDWLEAQVYKPGDITPETFARLADEYLASLPDEP